MDHWQMEFENRRRAKAYPHSFEDIKLVLQFESRVFSAIGVQNLTPSFHWHSLWYDEQTQFKVSMLVFTFVASPRTQ